MRLAIFLILLSCSNLGQAEPNCETLIASIQTSFNTATEVTMNTQIMQGKLEYAFSKIRLFKDEAGTWQSNVLEQRGLRRPPETQQRNKVGDEPDFEFTCNEPVITATTNGWQLQLTEPNPDFPIKHWTLAFREEHNDFIPLEIDGDIQTKLLFVPFRGTVSTSFENWVMPIVLPNNPREN